MKGEYSRQLNKMVYLHHRSFLQPHDPLHRDRELFPHQTDPRQPPLMKSMDFIDQANGKYASALTIDGRKKEVRKSGCKGTYALRKLPGHDRVLMTPVEPMHLIKNIAEHVVLLISGMEDSKKVRLEEQHRGRFESAWISRNTKQLPPAPFVLTAMEKKMANARAQLVRVTTGFDWKPRGFFAKGAHMKSHEWKQIMCAGILKFCLRGLLGKTQRMTLFVLCDILASVCQEELTTSFIDTLESGLHQSLARIERDFPTSINVIVFHLLHHLPLFLRRFGPVYGFWMYSFERFNSWISRRSLNRRFPEATVIETYRLYELAHYICVSTKLPPAALTMPWQESELLSAHEVTCDLSSDHLRYLDEFYQDALPQYKALTVRYKSERAKAVRRHRVQHFPLMRDWTPQNGPALCEDDVAICKGPTSKVTMLKYHKYQDHHHRTIIIGSEKSECHNSFFLNSYVSANLSSVQCFGRVQFLFSHEFSSVSTIFAFVSWYKGPDTDPESGLSCVSVVTPLTPKRNPIISVSQLSKPYIIARDDIDVNKVWILNYT